MKPTRQSGSKPLAHDKRDFKASRFFGSPDISQIPPEGLGRKPFSLNNQQLTNFCTACATSEANAFIRGVPMSMEFQAAKIGQLAGAPITDGADPRVAMKAGILYGSLPKDKAPMSLDTSSDGYIADYKNWEPSLDTLAGQNEDASYFQIDDGPNDAFDNIRAQLYLAYQERLHTGSKAIDVAMAFSQWFEQFNVTTVTYAPAVSVSGIGPFFSAIINFFRSIAPGLFGGEVWHAYLFIDWCIRDGAPYLIGQNSYGNAWGDQGVQYFSRETVNALFADYRAGAFMYREVNPADVKSWQDQQANIAVIDNDIITRLRNFLKI
jgi:hypothetical protein